MLGFISNRWEIPVPPSEKICPQCRCVYRWTATECSDCGIPLVHPDGIREDSLPIEGLVPIRIASVMWSRGFSQVLSEDGIPHRIDAPPTLGEEAEQLQRKSHDSEVAIYVRAADRERALAADARYMHSQIPDLPADFAPGAAPDAAQAEAGAGDADCPACGGALDERAAECPDCGLFLGEPT